MLGKPPLGVCPVPNDGWYPTGLRSDNVPSFDGLLPAASLLDVPNYPDGCYAESGTQFEFLQQSCDTGATAGEQPGAGSDTAGLSLVRYDPFASSATWSGNLTELVFEGDPADATNRAILMQELGDAS